MFSQHDGLTKKDGWFLDNIEIIKRNPRTGVEKMWLFMCQNWLSLHEGDCQISRQLFAKTHSKTGEFLYSLEYTMMTTIW